MQSKLTANFHVLYDPSLNLLLPNLAVGSAATRSTINKVVTAVYEVWKRGPWMYACAVKVHDQLCIFNT